jgi:hypothetical protein
MTFQAHQLEVLPLKPVSPTCTDHDDDCPGVRDKLKCYLYDPQRGMCPYLRGTDGVLPLEGKSHG